MRSEPTSATQSDEDGEEEEDVEDSACLYLTMPSEAGLKSLLEQWKRYAKGLSATPEHTALWKLFGYLKEIRVWSVQDRIDPSLAHYVERVLAADPARHVLIEVDLWYRSERERQDGAKRQLQET